MICQMVEHHRVRRVDGIGLGQQLYTILDRLGVFVVELENSQAHQGSHTLGVQSEGALKGKPGGENITIEFYLNYLHRF
jgi:hypothetical protein